MCVLLESETKTIKKHHKLKPFTAALCYPPPSFYLAANTGLP